MRDKSPSATAALIAAATVYGGNAYPHRLLIDSDAIAISRRIIATLPVGKRTALQILSRSPMHWLVRTLEHFTVPGISLHFALRKHFIEEGIKRAIANGTRQVLVLGAGFDTLAIRLHAQYPEVFFVECDHPATQYYKRRATSGITNGGFRLVPFDIANESLDLLFERIPWWNRDVKSVVIAEGLLMYLPLHKVKQLLAMIGRHCANSSDLIFTVMEPKADGEIDFQNAKPWAARLLRKWREPFLSGVARNELHALVEQSGWRLNVVRDNADLISQLDGYPSKKRPVSAPGELVCVASRV